ncbi:MAG: hypothetical protein K5744_06545 [Eubacterium sp.]|nr:hypothetical protein [Eubacterium sp.]
MKKIIVIAVVAALAQSLGVVAYAANNNRTSQPETTQSEQSSAKASRKDGEKTSDLPEKNGQPPQMNAEKPSGHPDMIDFDAMVKKGVISQETCDKIKAYMEEHRPSNLPEKNGQSPQTDGQAPEMGGQPPQTDGEKPSDLPEKNGQPPQMNGQVPEKNGQPSQTDGEKPSDLPEMNRKHPANGGLLNDLLSNGIITQTEYDALSEAIEE